MSEAELNVLLLAGRFEVRGSSAYTLRLAEHLPDHGFQARIICTNAENVAPGRRSTLGIEERAYLQTPALRRVVLEKLRAELSENRPDLIHVQSRDVLAEGSWLAGKLNCPLVLSVHDYLRLKEHLRLDRRYAKRIIAVSRSVKTELLKQIAVPENIVTVIHCGVEISDTVESPPVLDPGHVPVVGTAGPLEAVKGLPFFLGAAQKVLAIQEGVEFLIAGAGPEEANLRRLSRELKISEQVTFMPSLFDFSTSLAALDIFCLPSLRQGLGSIMLEAMALGKPVIASAIGGVDSVIRDNETGLMVPPSDSGQLARRIQDLLKDPVRARAVGEAGRHLVRTEFRVDTMVRKTAELYQEVLSVGTFAS